MALALIAARAAADPRLPLADVVADHRALGLAVFDSEDPTDPTASLPTVLSWSLRHLTEQQRTSFALLGIAPGPDIGLPAAVHLLGLPERETHMTMRALADASLLDRTPGSRYGMHTSCAPTPPPSPPTCRPRCGKRRCAGSWPSTPAR
ncbi:hypothetical protein [Amycolatopsis sp. NPDC003861]